MTKFGNSAAWVEIGGKRFYSKSKKEVVYAKMLEAKKVAGKIVDWAYEPQTFYFEGEKRGPVNYKPDYSVTENDGTVTWHEVKGWMDQRSKSKIKKFKKYFPELKLYVNGRLQ